MRKSTLIALSAGVIFNLIGDSVIADIDTKQPQDASATTSTSVNQPAKNLNKCGTAKCSTSKGAATTPQMKCGVNKCHTKKNAETASPGSAQSATGSQN